MDELISRQSLLKHEYMSCGRASMTERQEGFWDGVDAMSDVIKAAPAVSTAQTGKWIQKKTASGKTYCVCSNCNTDFKYKTAKGNLARFDMDGMNYCPKCGMRMLKGDNV